MTQPILSNPDFESIKGSLIDFLKSQSRYADYNFEGSNLSVLIDLLAYNTYHNAFHTNMLASESFLDTAQLKTSVYSLAKQLGYNPRSIKSSHATVTVTGSSTNETVVIPQGTVFSSSIDNQSFTFTNSESVVMTKQQDGKFAATIEVVEGFPVVETYNVNNDDFTVTLLISNIDHSTISIFDATNQLHYKLSNSTLNLDSESRVFFLQKNTKLQDQIYFGDGIIGKKIPVNSTILISYVVSSGESSNFCSAFVLSSVIPSLTNITVATVNPAGNGAAEESLSSIKTSAPQLFQARGRATIASDYKYIIKQNFPYVTDVAVYGGEDISPPQYGTVLISPTTSTGLLSDNQKSTIYDYLREKNVLTVGIEFTNPEYIYVGITSKVYYNPTTLFSEAALKQAVYDSIISYEDNNINKFNSSLLGSKLTSTIDSSNPYIINNDSKIYGILSVDTTSLSTGAVITSCYNAIEPGTISSSSFTINNVASSLVDEDGVIYLSSTVNGLPVKTNPVGTIDYAAGTIVLNQNTFTVSGNIITISYDFVSNDVQCKNNVIVKFNRSFINITTVPKYNN